MFHYFGATFPKISGKYEILFSDPLFSDPLRHHAGDVERRDVHVFRSLEDALQELERGRIASGELEWVVISHQKIFII